eukprot:evm.model.scf_248EXC.15 EVM.evm.TU.scf_248EXC.15   scf_248EXC:98588-100215(-)
MPPHSVASREERDRLRKELLIAEKGLTRQRDEVARRRRELPWVRVEKDYTFEAAGGATVRLSELFRDGKDDLVVYHFMYDPDWELPCDHCCCWADGFNAYLPFFEDKFNFAVVAKAPYERLASVNEMKGWTLPMYSSAASDFNKDCEVEDVVVKAGGKEILLSQAAAVSVFRKEDGVVYSTYNTSQRGLECFNAIWAFLDTLPNGREGWHPKHRHLYTGKRFEKEDRSSESHKRRKSQD